MGNITDIKSLRHEATQFDPALGNLSDDGLIEDYAERTGLSAEYVKGYLGRGEPVPAPPPDVDNGLWAGLRATWHQNIASAKGLGALATGAEPGQQGVRVIPAEHGQDGR